MNIMTYVIAIFQSLRSYMKIGINDTVQRLEYLVMGIHIRPEHRIEYDDITLV